MTDKLKKEMLEIAKTYPQSIKAYPRGAFEEQLAEFLVELKKGEKEDDKI